MNAPSNIPQLSDEELLAYLTPLHFEVFRLLPDSNQVHGFKPLVASVKFIVKRVNAENPPVPVTSSQLQAELRTLVRHDLVLSIKNPLSNLQLGWQRTERAVQLLDLYDARKGEN